MWTFQATRTDLLNIIQAERGLKTPDNIRFENSAQLPSLRSDLLLVWRENPRDVPVLPEVVIVPTLGTHDFLAWTSTYLADYNPITAQLRVLDVAHTDRYFAPHPLLSTGRLQLIFAAIILAETLAYFEGERDPGSIRGVVFGSTYSFSRARDTKLWGQPTGDDDLFNNWRLARSTLRNPRLSVDPEDLRLPWRIVSQIATGKRQSGQKSDEDLLANASEQLFHKGQIDSDLLNQICVRAGLPSTGDPSGKGLREDKVTALESMAKRKPNHDRTRDLYTFLCGYLANEISPGSFEHWAVVHRMFQDSRSVMLWYGLCAGLTPGSNVRDVFKGVGRRILRDVLSEGSVLDRPTADLALSEFGLTDVGRSGRPVFFTQNSGFVQIEIAPCVTTLISWSAAEPAPPEQDQLFKSIYRKPDPVVEAGVLEVRDTLRRLASAHEKLLQSMGFSTKPKRPERRNPKR
jgi:hypothetical protein